jgi:hypothetical protein
MEDYNMWDIGDPTFSRRLAYKWWWACQSYTPAMVYSTGSFPVLSSVRGWANPRTIVQLQGLDTLKKSNDLVRIRTHNPPVQNLNQDTKCFHHEEDLYCNTDVMTYIRQVDINVSGKHTALTFGWRQLCYACLCSIIIQKVINRTEH